MPTINTMAVHRRKSQADVSEVLTPNANINSEWDTYDFNSIIAVGGNAAEATRHDDYLEQIWGCTALTLAFEEITSITVSTRAMTDSGVGIMAVRVKIGSVWTSPQNMTLGDGTYFDDTATFVGSWTPGAIQIGVETGNISSSSQPWALDYLSPEVSGPLT